MLHKIKLLPLVLLLALLVGSCDEDPTGSNGVPNIITGKVTLQEPDSAGLTIEDRSGVTVRIEGTQFNAVTNSAGEYTLSGLPPGLFILHYTKPGYDTTTQYVEYSGVGVEFVNQVILYRIKSGSITLDPIAADRAGDLIDHPLVDSIQVNSVYSQQEQRWVFDTILFMDTAKFNANVPILILQGSAPGIPHDLLQLEMESAGVKRTFSGGSWLIKSVGDRFSKVLDYAYVGEYLDDLPTGTISGRLIYEVGGRQQYYVSNSQPIPWY